MNLRKALRRDRKIQKKRDGMQVDNKNIFMLEEQKKQKALEIKKKREEKEKLLYEEEI